MIVAGTDPQGPARAAGFEPNDRVVAIDGEPVTAMFREDIPALNRGLARRPFDKAVRFDYVRGDVTNQVAVTPKRKGDVEGKEVEFKRWGFTAKEVNRFDTPDLAFFAPDGGVFISSVSWDGNADNAGLKRRDIVKKVGVREIKAIPDLQAAYDEAITNLATKTQVGVDVLRAGRPMHFILNYRKDPEAEEEL